MDPIHSTPIDEIIDVQDDLISLDKLVDSLHSNELGYSILHVNIRSLRANFDSLQVEFRDILDDLTLIVLSETWVKNNDLSLYQLDGYTQFADCRSYNKSGGIVMFVKNNVKFDRINLSMLTAEVVVVHNSQSGVVVIGLYRSHHFDIPIFCDELIDLIKKINSSNIIIIGDINIDINSNSTHVNMYKDIMSEMGFYPYIQGPTRLGIHSSSTIDHIYIRSNIRSIFKSWRLNLPITDHLPIVCAFYDQLNFNFNNGSSVRNIINYSSLKRILDSVTWNSVYTVDNDVDTAYNNFNVILQNSIKTCSIMASTNKSKFIGNKKAKQWVDYKLIQMIKARDAVYKKKVKHPNNLDFTIQFRKLKSDIRVRIKILKQQYYFDKFRNSHKDTKKQWLLIKDLMGLRTRTTLPDFSPSNNLCNDFNSTFLLHQSKFNGCDLKNVKTSIAKNFSSFYLNPTTVHEVKDIIMGMKNTSGGYDGLNSSLLKYVVDSIANPLSHIANLSMSTGTFPCNLKRAILVPVYKSGDKNNLNNYRPISLLSNISKILEKLVYKRLYSYLSSNKILSDNQFGFRKGLSTTHALVQFSNFVIAALNDGFRVSTVFLDLKKAFDTVDHDILLHKLYGIGVRGLPLCWFSSYLVNRQQSVRVGPFCGNWATPISGVPQGSILGPLLFNIYINDIFDLSLSSNIISYADDVALLVRGNDDMTLKILMENDISIISHWLSNNNLKMNESKTKFIVFGNKAVSPQLDYLKLHSMDCNCHLSCQCSRLDRVDKIKYLGVLVEASFTWKGHILNVQSSLRKLLCFVYHIKHFLPIQIKRMIYFSLIQSVLSYSIIIWGGTYISYINPLNILIKRFIRNLNLQPSDVIMDIRQLYVFRLVLFLYNNPYCLEFKQFDINLRNSNIPVPYVPRVKKSLFQKQFIFLAPKILRAIPADYKFVNFNLFKRFMSNYVYNVGDIESLLNIVS